MVAIQLAIQCSFLLPYIFSTVSKTSKEKVIAKAWLWRAEPKKYFSQADDDGMPLLLLLKLDWLFFSLCCVPFFYLVCFLSRRDAEKIKTELGSESVPALYSQLVLFSIFHQPLYDSSLYENELVNFIGMVHTVRHHHHQHHAIIIIVCLWVCYGLVC